MGYLITLVISINSLLGASRKKYFVYFMIVTNLLMWLTFGWNFKNPDYFNYQIMYTSVQNSSGLLLEGKDLGFKLLMNLTSFLGMNYQMFIIILSFIGLILILITVKRFSPNPMYVYLLYFIFPYFLDIVQIRNFLMMSILIYSLRYLVEDKRKSITKYLVSTLIAASIHSVAVLYFPLVFVKSKNKNLIRIGVFLSLCFSVIVFANNNEIPFIKQILGLFTDNRFILRWFDMNTNFGFLLPWSIHIFSYLIMLVSKKIINKYNQNLENNELHFFYAVYWVSVISFFFFPLYMVNTEFSRLMRNFSILYYISFSIANKAIGLKNARLKLKYNLLVIIYIFILVTIQLLIPHFDTVIKAVLENNLLW